MPGGVSKIRHQSPQPLPHATGILIFRLPGVKREGEGQGGGSELRRLRVASPLGILLLKRGGLMRSKSYIQLQRRYGGRFVASYRGRVIATAKTSRALFKKIAAYLGDPALMVQYIAPQRAVCIY